MNRFLRYGCIGLLAGFVVGMWQWGGMVYALPAMALSAALVGLYSAKSPEEHYIGVAPVLWRDEHGLYECWFHLYETEDGKRRASYQPNTRQFDGNEDVGRRHILYNRVILPWIEGRYTNEAVLSFFAKSHENTSNVNHSDKVIDITRFRR